jgi:hypothetical protein
MIAKSLLVAAVITASPWAASDAMDKHIGVCVTHLWLTNQTEQGEILLKRVTSSKEMRQSASKFADLIRKDVDKAMDQAAKSCKVLNQPLFPEDNENG